jgi:DNA repair exonuclease SbcCD ATPase subunit
MKKYKDLHKIVISKKEVYERLMASCESNNVNDSELSQYNDDLELLIKEKEQLTNENNSIAIDANNKENQIIMQTNYDNLIAKLGKIEIENELEYQQAKELLNELKVLFKNINDKELLKLKQSYKTSIKLLEEKIKPCEYEIIESEERALCQYKEIKLEEKYSNLSIIELQNELDKLNLKHTELSKEYDRLNNEKPVSCNKPPVSYNSIIQDINKLFISCDNAVRDMISYCSNNPYINDPNNKINGSKKGKNTTKINLMDYNDSISKKGLLEERVLSYKTKLTEIDTEFKLLYSKQNKVIIEPLPSVKIALNSSYEIKKRLDERDIAHMIDYVNKNELILENFYKGFDYINKLNDELHSYENELNLLNTNDEYKYNPNCEYCCKRSWVCRMKELEIIIERMKKDIEEENRKVFEVEIDYINVYENVSNYKNKIAEYDLNTMWYKYYLYKEEYDRLCDEINLLLNHKQGTNVLLQNDEKELSECLQTILTFNNNAHKLNNDYDAHNQYEVFNNWKKAFDKVNKEKKDIEYIIKTLSNYIILKPRYDKLIDLKNQYNEWYNYHQNNMIVKAKEYYEIKSRIDQYNKYNEYKTCEELKPLIERKVKMMEQICDIDKKIKNINDMISKLETIKEYNNTYNSNVQKLLVISNDIENKIELMDTVIDKFKDYRKDLYENVILKGIVDKTNRYIGTLCHGDTKKFEIDYLINEVKDIIHINWLIRNVVDNDTKQVISINQASGYQRFVISLSLRMSLYSNKQCSQLFFDEGFTACDKNNLSIVPSFLRGLLKLFDSVIIASHIELIQDSVDNKVEISYNPVTKSSSITYGDCLDTKVKFHKSAKSAKSANNT